MKTLSTEFRISTRDLGQNLIKVIGIVLLTFLMPACILGNKPIAAKQNIPFPDADFTSILWFNDKLIAFTSAPIQFSEQGSSLLNNLILPEDSNCTLSTRYSIAGMFPDGRLQVQKSCFTEPHTEIYLMAYDWNTGNLDEIAGPLPLGTSEAYMNPEQTEGIVFLDDGFARKTLYSIWEGGFGPLDLVITDQRKSWNLKNFYPDFPDSEKPRSGNAGRADWSPDGDSIAFFASSDAIGKTDLDRFYVEYKLYIMNAKKLDLKPVLDNIYFPHIIEWSPDSKYIAFIGQYGKSKQDGVWLYSVENNSIVNIDKGKFQNILWDMDGTKLFAIKCDSNYYCSQILGYDLSEVIQP